MECQRPQRLRFPVITVQRGQSVLRSKTSFSTPPWRSKVEGRGFYPTESGVAVDQGTCLKRGGKDMKYDRDALIVGSSTLLAGFLVGMAVGMLVTPYSGVRMRRRLRFLSEDWLESIMENLDEVVVRGQRVIASGFQKLAI
jgi:hypothetical protein